MSGVIRKRVDGKPTLIDSASLDLLLVERRKGSRPVASASCIVTSTRVSKTKKEKKGEVPMPVSVICRDDDLL